MFTIFIQVMNPNQCLVSLVTVTTDCTYFSRMLLNLDQTRLLYDFQTGPTVLTCSDFDVPADDGAQPVPGSAVVAGQVDVVS